MSIQEKRAENEEQVENLRKNRGIIMNQIKAQAGNSLRGNKLRMLIRDRTAVEKIISKVTQESGKQLARRYENVRQQIRSLGVEDIFEPDIELVVRYMYNSGKKVGVALMARW